MKWKDSSALKLAGDTYTQKFRKFITKFKACEAYFIANYWS